MQRTETKQNNEENTKLIKHEGTTYTISLQVYNSFRPFI